MVPYCVKCLTSKNIRRLPLPFAYSISKLCLSIIIRKLIISLVLLSSLNLLHHVTSLPEATLLGSLILTTMEIKGNTSCFPRIETITFILLRISSAIFLKSYYYSLIYDGLNTLRLVNGRDQLIKSKSLASKFNSITS